MQHSIRLAICTFFCLIAIASGVGVALLSQSAPVHVSNLNTVDNTAGG